MSPPPPVDDVVLGVELVVGVELFVVEDVLVVAVCVVVVLPVGTVPMPGVGVDVLGPPEATVVVVPGASTGMLDVVGVSATVLVVAGTAVVALAATSVVGFGSLLPPP